ncbi:CRTAC1 family protein [Meiothermus sp.]|uniref:CRTAC1 family protein n=1 Tax=Meiothermus sp. TaxID=1955249 RepID=UPI0021DEA34D|nr:CRTAC1 family protein [Meiothermus sp.]GIW23902.1 MAG: hypothetical protein KatS3mg069_0169 [Meiothermus sp.]
MRMALSKVTLALLLGSLGAGAAPPHAPSDVTVAVAVDFVKLEQGLCGTAFEAHDLPHTAQGRWPVRGFDGNGAGVGLGDLNNDGLIEIVLASQVGEASVLWNRGQLRFEREALPTEGTKAVALVDVDADGWLDITFTHNNFYPSYWRNQNGRFVQQRLEGVRQPAFVFLWDDLLGRGRLDLVTASYDPSLEAENRDGFLFGRGAGVFLYEAGPQGYTEQRLSPKAFALGLVAFDADLDGQRDLIVGNDFDLPDMAWRWDNGTWQQFQPFRQFSKHPMGFALGDIQNDGVPELFSTDMKPDFRDLKTLATWMPLLERGYKKFRTHGPQKTENMLQVRQAQGFRNMAYALGLDATGWSWSAKFGDLDNDGWQDLYVVNGMMDIEQFPYLPGGELVEENRVFRNHRSRFEHRPDWKLGSKRSARGMSMADLDNDGDLDIVVGNLSSPAQLFENRLCGYPALEVELRWPKSQNTRAIGAEVILHSNGWRQWRQVTATSGYLSGDAPRLHFALPQEEGWLEVVWPDGKRSWQAAKAGQLLILTRGETP